MATRIYLLHFDPPYLHARHYLGIVSARGKRVEERVEEHVNGLGSPLVRAAAAAGARIVIARTWTTKQRASRTRERQLKKWKMSPRLCPICNRKKYRHRYRGPRRLPNA